MSFFKHEQKPPTAKTSAPMNSLTARLVSNHEPTFLGALQEAVRISDQGDYEGIRSIREAIRIRSGKETVSFYQPGIRRGFAGEELDRYTKAKPAILKMAKKHTLLEDTRVSGDYIAALMFSLDTSALQELLMDIFKTGGASDGYEFQLLYNELRSSARWSER